MPTKEQLRDELRTRTLNAIEREEHMCFDIASEFGQMFGNVKHTTWFKKEVARWFLYNVKKYEPLRKKPAPPDDFGPSLKWG